MKFKFSIHHLLSLSLLPTQCLTFFSDFGWISLADTCILNVYNIKLKQSQADARMMLNDSFILAYSLTCVIALARK